MVVMSEDYEAFCSSRNIERTEDHLSQPDFAMMLGIGKTTLQQREQEVSFKAAFVLKNTLLICQWSW